MELKVTGRLFAAFAPVVKSEKFTFRKFWLEIATDINGTVYHNYAEFQLVNNKCSLLDQFMQGQTVVVSFNFKGNLWTDPQGQQKCINTLDAWKIEAVGMPTQQGYQQPMQQQVAPPQQQQWQQPAQQGFPQQQAPQPQQWNAPQPQQWNAPQPQPGYQQPVQQQQFQQPATTQQFGFNQQQPSPQTNDRLPF